MAVHFDGACAVAVAEHSGVHFAAQFEHFCAFGAGREVLAAVVEGLNLFRDGEVFVGDGAVGDFLWWSRVFELSECLSLPGLSDGRRGRLGRCAAAVIGGVVGPISAAGSLPGNGDADVDAEESGEHGGGQFGGQAEQRCRSILSGPGAFNPVHGCCMRILVVSPR